MIQTGSRACLNNNIYDTIWFVRRGQTTVYVEARLVANVEDVLQEMWVKSVFSLISMYTRLVNEISDRFIKK